MSSMTSLADRGFMIRHIASRAQLSAAANYGIRVAFTGDRPGEQ